MYKKETGNRYWVLYKWLNHIVKFAGYNLNDAKKVAMEINRENPSIEVKIVKEVGSMYG